MHANKLDLAELLDFDPVTLRVRNHEGTLREFKQQFEPNKFPTYIKSLAGFANHDGGTLFFGVSNKPRDIVGVNEVAFSDVADWQKKASAFFDPALVLSVEQFHVSGKTVVAVSVQSCANKPVICTRDASILIERKGRTEQAALLQQGVIYYRYSGTVEPIRYAEMIAILQERDERRLKSIMENLRLLDKVGFESAGVVDLKRSGTLEGERHIYLSEQAAKNLHVIERGRIVSDDGAPAYMIQGKLILNKVITKPWDDADKNLPEETASQMRPHLEAIYGAIVPKFVFNASHLSKIAVWLKIRTAEKVDARYMIDEPKFKRRFYTRQGIEFMMNEIKARPLEAIEQFGSRSAAGAFRSFLKGAKELGVEPHHITGAEPK